MMAAMPSAGRVVAPLDCLQAFEKLTQSEHYKLANASHQAKCTTLQKLIGRICDQRSPESDMCREDAMLSEVVALIPFFIRAEQKVEGEEGTTLVFGSAALKVLYPDIKAKADAGTSNFEQVAPFRIYAYLASPIDKPSYLALADSVETHLGSLSAGRAKKSKSGTANAADDSAVRAALDMFS